MPWHMPWHAMAYAMAYATAYAMACGNVVWHCVWQSRLAWVADCLGRGPFQKHGHHWGGHKSPGAASRAQGGPPTRGDLQEIGFNRIFHIWRRATDGPGPHGPGPYWLPGP